MGYPIPSVLLLPILGFSLVFNRKTLIIFLIFAIVILKTLYVFYNTGNISPSFLKIFDAMVFLSFVKLNPVRRYHFIVIISLFLSILIANNNANFVGWLFFLVAILISDILDGLPLRFFLIVLSVFCFQMEANTYGLACLSMAFYLVPLNPARLFVYGAVFTSIIITVYNYFLNTYDSVSAIFLLAPTVFIRLSMWTGYMINLDLMNIFLGVIDSFNSVVDTRNMENIILPFDFVGMSYHNIWIDMIWKYGIIGIFLLLYLFKLLPKRVYFLPLMLIWSFEPSLGVFQLVTIIFIEKRYFNVSHLYSRPQFKS